LLVLSGLSCWLQYGRRIRLPDHWSSCLLLAAHNALVSYIEYVRQTFWPRDWPFSTPIEQSTFDLEGYLASAFLLTVSAIAISLRKKRPMSYRNGSGMSVCWCRSSGSFRLANQGHADRYNLPAYIGLFLLIVWGAADLANTCIFEGSISGLRQR